MIVDYRSKEKYFLLKTGLKGFFLLIIIVNLLCLTSAYGAEYPTKAVQIVVNYPPGSLSDITARLVSKKLSTLLRQPVVVVNKAGGMGTVGIQSVADAPPDGYTILISAQVILLAPLTVKGVSFRLSDFTPINLAASTPSVLSVKKDAPWKTLEEMIAEAKKNPGKLSYSSAGPSTIPHLVGELFKMYTATDITHIPMDGQATAITAVLGGHADMTFVALGGLRSHLEAGSLRALTIMTRHRLEEFPDVPTTTEKGYPKLIAATWQTFFVSAKTPPVIVKKLGEVFKETLTDKETIELIKKAGLQVDNLGPEEAARFLREDQEKLSEIVKSAKIGE